MKLKLLAMAALTAASAAAVAQTTYVVPGPVVTQPAPAQVVIPASPGGNASTSVAPAVPAVVAPAPVVVAPAPAVVAPAPVVSAPPNTVAVVPAQPAVAVVGTPITVTQKPGDSGPGSVDRTHPGMEPYGGNLPSGRDVGTSSAGG